MAKPCPRREHARRDDRAQQRHAEHRGHHVIERPDRRRHPHRAPRRDCAAGCNPGNDASTPPSARSTTPGNRPNPRQSAASNACGASITRGASCASAAAVLRGRARKLMPKTFTKHAAASALVKRQQRRAQRIIQSDEPGRRTEPEQQRLKCQPLADKAVQERQTGDRHRADEEEESRPGHASQQAAKLFELPRARPHHHASRAEKQQPFEHGVIQHVRQTGGDRHGRQFGPAVRQRQHPRAQSEDHDPGVLDRAVGEEPLEIALGQARTARPRWPTACPGP